MEDQFWTAFMDTINIYKEDGILRTYFNNKQGIQQFLYQYHSYCDKRRQSVKYFIQMHNIIQQN
jgi:hypothetical protein